MIRIELKISNIDYEETAIKLLPVLLQKMKEKGDRSSKFAKVILGLKGMPNKIVKGALSVLPQSTKDDMAVYFMNAYKEDILEWFNNYTKEKQIDIKIQDAVFENVNQVHSITQKE